MDWTAEEVVRYYRIAKNKTEQIEILAQLTVSDISTVIEVLKDAGELDEKLLKKFKKCTKCGCYISGRSRSKYCKTCGAEVDRKRRAEAANRRNKEKARMKRTTYYCDRCGKEVINWGKSRSIAVAEITYDSSYKGELDAPKDLCGDCYKSLESWWKEGGSGE